MIPRTAGSMWGTTPPWLITTLPSNLFNLALTLVPRNACGKCDLLFVVTDSKLQVTRNNTLLLVVTSSVSGQLENLSSKILKHGGEIDCILREYCSEQEIASTYQVRQHRRVGRSCPSSRDGGHDQLGTGDLPWQNATAGSFLQRPRFSQTWTFQSSCQTFLVIVRWLRG